MAWQMLAHTPGPGSRLRTTAGTSSYAFAFFLFTSGAGQKWFRLSLHHNCCIWIAQAAFHDKRHDICTFPVRCDSIKVHGVLFARSQLRKFHTIYICHKSSDTKLEIKPGDHCLCTGVDDRPFNIEGIVWFVNCVIARSAVDAVTVEFRLDNGNPTTAASTSNCGGWDDHEWSRCREKRSRRIDNSRCLSRDQGFRCYGGCLLRFQILRCNRQGNRRSYLILN